MIETIPLKVLIIDKDESSAQALCDVLQEVDNVLTVHRLESYSDAPGTIESKDVNTIYIDPIGLGIDAAAEFIFHVRRRYPSIVFVLYLDAQERQTLGEAFYTGKKIRLRHYYKLLKGVKDAGFREQVLGTVFECTAYLSYNMSQENIQKLKDELATIQSRAGAAEESTNVPLQTLKDIQEQLIARQKETRPSIKPAEFLGSYPQTVNYDRCFVVMPYSELWSKGVERLLREVCEDTGFEFSIAHLMEGRFVARDVWQGIAGSGVVVADLTGANANVTYEVGLADSIGREVVLICQGSNVPFDFHGHRLILYENSVPGTLKLRDKLKERLNGIKTYYKEHAKKGVN